MVIATNSRGAGLIMAESARSKPGFNQNDAAELQLTDLSPGPLSEITSYLGKVELGVLRQAGCRAVLRDPCLTKHLNMSVPQTSVQDWAAETGVSNLEQIRQMCERGVVRLPHTLTDQQLSALIDKGILDGAQKLVLRGCHQLTKAGIAHLSQLTNLRSLDLSWCFQLIDEDLSGLSGLEQLESLNLSHCQQIKGHGIAHLSALENLVSLNLEGCSQLSDAI